MKLQVWIKQLLFFLALTGTTWLGMAQDHPPKPNIVFILADDFGYGSLNVYGADHNLVRTPNIDRLADEGMRFTDASTPASICTPTRYGFLTGRYPWRTRLKYGVTGILSGLLPDTDRVTIADWLHERGYHTAAIGKWHLGYGDHGEIEDPSVYARQVSPGPLDLGFDYHFGVPQNHDDAWGVFVENDHIYGIRSDRVHPYSRSFYGRQYIGYDAPQRVNTEVMEVLTDRSVDWIRRQTGERPFFLYFAAVAVHHPITPSDYMRGMSDCGPYGDFIQDLDQCVGRILETLEYMNFMENTMLIFSSDNGGDIPGAGRPDAPENQAIHHGLKINGDLRGDKHTIYEGGTNVPFIVSWPGVVRQGSVSDDMVNLLDIFATVCEITDGTVPEAKEVAPDSYSFLPSLLEKTHPHPRASMVTADANGMQALRLGDWKYIDDSPPEGLPEDRLSRVRDFQPQLYNLEADPGEKRNLYDGNPGMAKKLSEQLAAIRNSDFTR
jgi:arylsulfatase A-like enzyme